jgi:tetratricopeptide (TPR) repeat protein
MTRSGPLVPILYGLTLLAVFTLALSSLTEFDFWWYLASGERILATRSVPATDPFSYTAQGRPWINHMWASQVLVLKLWQAGGRVALVILKGLIVTATFGVVLLTMRRRGVHPILASLVTLVAAWAGWEFWDVRPQIVTYLLLGVFLYLLREGWETRPRTLAWLPLLMVPWANLHAGFVTGIAVIGLVGVGTALPSLARQEQRRAGWRVLGLATGVGAVTGLASLVNPFGLQAVLFPLEVVNTRLFMSSTAEWFSPNFHNPAYRGFELMLLLLVPAFAWGRARLGVTDALVGLTFAHLGLSSARHTPLFAVAVAPLLADGLQGSLQEAWSRQPRAWDLAGRLQRALPSLWPIVISARTPVAVAAFGLLVGVAAGWIGFLDPLANPFLQDLNERRYPRETIGFIKRERLPAPLFNAYAWGGYELWRLYPDYRVFIDGRTHVYGREVLQDFLEINTLGPRWRAVLDKWRIETVLAQRPSQLAQVLLAVGGWRLVFAEHEAAVFVRESDGNQALLERLPPVSLWQPLPEVLTALVAGLSAVEAGDDERAIRHYREALAVAPDHPVALMSLGILQAKRGRTAEARALFERIVELYREGDLVDKARGRLRGLP